MLGSVVFFGEDLCSVGRRGESAIGRVGERCSGGAGRDDKVEWSIIITPVHAETSILDESRYRFTPVPCAGAGD